MEIGLFFCQVKRYGRGSAICTTLPRRTLTADDALRFPSPQSRGNHARFQRGTPSQQDFVQRSAKGCRSGELKRKRIGKRIAVVIDAERLDWKDEYALKMTDVHLSNTRASGQFVQSVSTKFSMAPGKLSYGGVHQMSLPR